MKSDGRLFELLAGIISLFILGLAIGYQMGSHNWIQPPDAIDPARICRDRGGVPILQGSGSSLTQCQFSDR